MHQCVKILVINFLYLASRLLLLSPKVHRVLKEEVARIGSCISWLDIKYPIKFNGLENI